ncbi:MAG: hypothetical protein ACU0CO_18475 [Shimia sp.]
MRDHADRTDLPLDTRLQRFEALAIHMTRGVALSAAIRKEADVGAAQATLSTWDREMRVVERIWNSMSLAGDLEEIGGLIDALDVVEAGPPPGVEFMGSVEEFQTVVGKVPSE